MLKIPDILLENKSILINIDKIKKEAEVRLNGGYDKPKYCFFIDDVGVFTLSNFSTITGKAKSMKTTLLAFVLTSFFTQEQIYNKFYANYEGKILHFDTEQSKFHMHRLISFACGMAHQETQPLNFDSYCLRPYTTSERLEIIEKIIYETENIILVIIDGIRDLIKDINSADEATMITSKLMKWTHEKDCHICVVIHQNKGDNNNVRGHLGTELVNKSETVFSVNKKTGKNYSIVKCEQSRGMEFKPFGFGINNAGRLFVKDVSEDELEF